MQISTLSYLIKEWRGASGAGPLTDAWPATVMPLTSAKPLPDIGEIQSKAKDEPDDSDPEFRVSLPLSHSLANHRLRKWKLDLIASSLVALSEIQTTYGCLNFNISHIVDGKKRSEKEL